MKFDLAHVQSLDTFAKGISSSSLLPGELKGKVGDIIVQMQYGHEIGIQPLTALNGIHIIQGKPTLSANLMMTLIESSNKGYIEVVEETVTCVRIKGVRYGLDGREDREYVTEFTIEDAKNAALTSSPNWKKYPKDMLFSKVLGRVARRMFSDVIQGMYAQGELDGKDFKSGEEVVSRMEGVEVKQPPKAKAKTVQPPEKEKIVEAEIVDDNILNDDSISIEDEFRSHMLTVTAVANLAPAIKEFQAIKGVVIKENPKLGIMVKMHRFFLANPAVDSELSEDGTIYTRDLVAQF